MGMRNIKVYAEHLREFSEQDLLNRALLNASKVGDLDQIRSLLDRGAQVDAEDTYKQTSLHNAAWNGYTEIVMLLLDRGAQVDAEDAWDRTALNYSVLREELDDDHSTAKLLILRGADPSKEFDDMAALTRFFKGDIGWMPEELKSKLERRLRSRGAFGRF